MNVFKTEEFNQEWTTDEMREEFKVIGFGFGYVAVQRKSDGQKGSLDFSGTPRKYFGFVKS